MVGCEWLCGGVWEFRNLEVWMFGVLLWGVWCFVGVCSGRVTKVTFVTCVGTLEGLEALCLLGCLGVGVHGFLPSFGAAPAL